MATRAVRFRTPYQNYNPSTVFQVDEATKTLRPFESGQAFTDAGFQFGQEEVLPFNTFGGYSVGPVIGTRAAALGQIKNELNQFQNDTFAEESAPKRLSSTLSERIGGEADVNDALSEFSSLVKRYQQLQDPNLEQAYRGLRAEQNLPELEQDFLEMRRQRRELPYVQRARTGNAGIATESQLAEQTQQLDIPLEIQEANLLDRLTLAQDFVNNAVKLKEGDATNARTALESAIALVGQTIQLSQSNRQIGLAEREFAFDSAVELERLTLEKAKAALEANPGLNFDDNMKILERFLTQSKPFLDVQASYNRILSTDDTAAGDLALIFNYMKMLDPASVVREGEFATAQNAAGIPAQIRNLYNRMVSGERLAPEQRADFRKQAENLYRAQADQQQALRDTFTNFAGNFPGIDPSIAVPDLGSVSGQDGGAPPIEKLMIEDDAVFRKMNEMLGQGIPYDVAGQAVLEELGFKKKTSYLNTLGKVTAFGSPYWDHGLDIDLQKGQPVRSPVSGTVIAARENGGFGLQVKIRTADGKEVWLSHLDRFNVQPGMQVSAGQVIGLGGNSGKVIAQGGGDGSHLDVTIKHGDRIWSAKEVFNFLRNINV